MTMVNTAILEALYRFERLPLVTSCVSTVTWTTRFTEKLRSHTVRVAQNGGSHPRLRALRPEFSRAPILSGDSMDRAPVDGSSRQDIARACSAHHCQEQGPKCPPMPTNRTPGAVGQRHPDKVPELGFSPRLIPDPKFLLT